jgi:glycosyltransferase involved in cell wall biosynthesis
VIPVAFDLRDPVRSGIARVARSLARALLDEAGERFSITLAGPVDALEQIGARQWGRGTARLVNWDAPRYSPRAELRWRSVLRQTRGAVWYFPHWDIPWSATPDRFVLTVHDLNHVLAPEAISLPRRILARHWMRRAVVRARRIAVVSNHTSRQLQHTWPDVAHKAALVPNGVEPRFLTPPPPVSEPLAQRVRGRPWMLSVGILRHHKNLARAIDVLAAIPNLAWVVVGEQFADWDDILRLAAAANVADRIVQLAPQPDDVLHALYGAATCLFFPSRREGFGLPILEAFASGTPVVASTAGASAETSGGLAALCDPDDAPAFSKAVAAAIASGRQGAEERKQYAAQFTWRQSARALAVQLEAAAR